MIFTIKAGRKYSSGKCKIGANEYKLKCAEVSRLDLRGVVRDYSQMNHFLAENAFSVLNIKRQATYARKEMSIEHNPYFTAGNQFSWFTCIYLTNL